jgi:pimeloyl-ACP methyl ester carboxylesterase
VLPAPAGLLSNSIPLKAKGDLAVYRFTTTALLAATVILPAGADDPTDVLKKAPSHFAKFDKTIKVHYKSFGAGKTAVVFVHGAVSDMFSWYFQVPAFAGKTRVLVIDLPGHGKSDKPMIDYSMDLFARAIDAVLLDAGVEKAVLVGHSMGVPVICRFWKLYPAKTAALVVADGPIAPLPPPKDKLPEWAVMKKQIVAMSDKMVGTDAPEEVRQAIKDAILNTPDHVALSTMKEVVKPVIDKDDKIKVPILMILRAEPKDPPAKKYYPWTADYEQQVRQVAPQLEFHKMEGANHLLMLQMPKEFNALLSGFLEKQGVLKP